jgi:ESS family glutamate:Na+ symporter
MLKLDLIHTVAFAGVMLFVGYGIRRLVPILARYNIPAPVIGGLLVTLATLFARQAGVTLFQFDTTLQAPLMTAFFTSVGFGASTTLLRAGGPQVLVFFALASVVAVVQNLVGVALAIPFDLHPLFGVLSGSVTMAGGPATGLAFAPEFARAGVPGAASVAIAAAMAGIIAGGLLGGPMGTRLIERYRLAPARAGKGASAHHAEVPSAAELVEARVPEPAPEHTADESAAAYTLLKSVVAILVAMWIGSWVSAGVHALGLTVPAYIGAMLVAALLRFVDDRTRLIGLSQRTIDDLGAAALSLFLVLALMTLKLWELAALALPIIVMVVVQTALVAALCVWPVFRVMGRDYDAAVMGGGFCGFMLGTTANAMANMTALVERYGPAPRAFLVVPMVGAFFIDFTNAIIITIFLNVLR